jgi:alpha-mannosidase
MKFQELIVLLPCHSLEDFPTHYEGVDAEGLLAAWSALWHPALLASAERVPTWYRADAPPDELSGRLLLIPSASESLLLAGWASRANTEGAHVIRKLHRRSEMVDAALAALDGMESSQPVDPKLAADFLALGTCYLLVELLTRQMRYMSNVDEVHLSNETLAAAKAAVAGNEEEARRHLQHCFEVLTEARERFYPVNAYIVDLTLVAPTTLGQPLRGELDSDCPLNLVLSGQTLERLAQEDPDTLQRLKLALDHKSASIVGGEYAENELPLVPVEAIAAGFERGLANYEKLLGERPTVYGRRRFGLTPALPQILTRFGFEGALHVTLDDGQFPQSEQCKSRWEGLDSSVIDMLSRLPLDASAAESFLHFPRKMGESMDMDHVATVTFAHWPGQASDYYEDLRRMASYGAALGKFITLVEYFAHTDRPSEVKKFKADAYRAPYLRQAIIRQQADPLSRHVRGYQRRGRTMAVEALETFTELLTRKPGGHGQLLTELAQATAASDETALAALDSKLADQHKEAVDNFSKAVAGSGANQYAGYLVANPDSFARQMAIDVSELSALPEIAEPVVAAQEHQCRKVALVKVPGCGFAWIRPAKAPQRPMKKVKPSKPLAEGNVLRNEFFEVTIDPTTGALRSIFAVGVRGNRLSQQLAFRLPSPRPKPGDLWKDPDEDAAYSVMAADGFEVVSPGPAWGEIVARGRLLDPNGKRLAGFRQTFQVFRGSRVIALDIELDIDEQPRAEAWNSYYASRFAWGDADAEVRRSVSQTSQLTTAKRVEAPLFVEIKSEKSRTTDLSRTSIYTGGLPYHRYNGVRMLDTLLMVRGESQRRFRLGIGIDVPHPTAEAWDLLAPPAMARQTNVPSDVSGSSWLFHVDAKNVIVTSWQSICEDDRVVGFRVRLLETAGKPGRVALRTFRPPSAARQIDFRGETLVELSVESDKILIDFAAMDWVEVEARLEWGMGS